MWRLWAATPLLVKGLPKGWAQSTPWPGKALPQPVFLLLLPQVDATVKSWNVKILGLNRQSRHRDLTVAQVRPGLRRCGGLLGVGAR